MIEWAALAAAVVLAAAGGEWFVQGVLRLAAQWRLPRALVATTLAAAATSAPEGSVSMLAALDGRPAIGFGDALGSNVFNIAVVLGLALLAGPLPAAALPLRRDYLLALAAPFATLALAADGQLDRADALLLGAAFATWLLLSVRDGRRQRRAATAAAAGGSSAAALALLGVGLLCLVVGGRLFVFSATALAGELGVPDFVVGATVVAIGTSLPELATTLAARLRGHDDIGLGTVLGSNLFNGLAIVAAAASIHPIATPLAPTALALGAGVLALLLLRPRDGWIPRWRGVALLALYASFVAATAIAR
jgi:cation:H+ antiporter